MRSGQRRGEPCRNRARQHVLDAGQFAPPAAPGLEQRSLGALHLRVGRNQVERRLLFARPSMTQDRARRLDAGQVIELVALPEFLVRRGLGRTLHDDDAVANLLQHLRAPCGKLLFRQRRGKERRLGRRHRDRSEQHQRGQQRGRLACHIRRL